jgi:hypothetical protein
VRRREREQFKSVGDCADNDDNGTEEATMNAAVDQPHLEVRAAVPAADGLHLGGRPIRLVASPIEARPDANTKENGMTTLPIIVAVNTAMSLAARAYYGLSGDTSCHGDAFSSTDGIDPSR